MSIDLRKHWNGERTFGFRYIEQAPTVMHCHHFNLFLDQTIDDALGREEGTRLRTIAARDAAFQFLRTVSGKLELNTPQERVAFAEALFAGMGHGKLELSLDSSGGHATSITTHYGFSWREKYGHKIARRTGADAVASGICAAAAAFAFDSPISGNMAFEEQCIARGDSACHFTVKGDASVPDAAIIDRAESLQPCGETTTGRSEDTISAITQGLIDFTSGNLADPRGLVQAFGVFVTLHMANYYNRISYGAIDHIDANAPQLRGVLESLLQESGHVCVFNTFGGILISPEWEAMVGPLSGDPEETITYCMAIARALGFGHWALIDYEPERHLVVRAPATYESAFHKSLRPPSTSGTCYMFQGAGLAMMQLAHRLDLTSGPTLDQELYGSLFKRGVPWRVEETHCITKGDPYDEVVVTLK